MAARRSAAEESLTSMALGPRLELRHSQALVMTPQLRQAIRLLQLSAAELEVEIAQAVESNPLLDWTESSIAALCGA